MSRIETLFLSVVLVFAGVFSTLTFVQTLDLARLAGFSGGGAVGSAGKPREVDMKRLETMLKQGYLTKRKALYYHSVESREVPATLPKPVPSPTPAGR